MECQEAEGWERRFATKVTIAGCTGVAVGSTLAMLNNAPLARFTAMSTASFVLLMGCFSAVQEGSRRARCRNSPLNSALGGAAAGALLFASHGASAPRGAVICAALGSAAHWTSDSLNLDITSRRVLVSMGLLDAEALPPVAPKPAHTTNTSSIQSIGSNGELLEGGVQEGEGGDKKGSGIWEMIRPYMPVRRMTEAEWEAHQAKQAEDDRLKEEIVAAGREKRYKPGKKAS